MKVKGTEMGTCSRSHLRRALWHQHGLAREGSWGQPASQEHRGQSCATPPGARVQLARWPRGGAGGPSTSPERRPWLGGRDLARRVLGHLSRGCQPQGTRKRYGVRGRDAKSAAISRTRHALARKRRWDAGGRARTPGHPEEGLRHLT